MHEALPEGGLLRKLWIGEANIYRNHLLRLDRDSRHSRFGGAVSDEFIENYVTTAFGLNTVVICPRVDNCIQWVNECLEIAPYMSDQICLKGSVTDKSSMATPENAKLLVMRGGMLIPRKNKITGKMELEIPATTLRRYEMVILDETHLLATEGQMLGVLNFTGATYVIGCSGTPEKPDKRHEMIQFIVGRESIQARRYRSIDFVFFNMKVFTDGSVTPIALSSP